MPLSVDTYKPAVMRAALAAGASMINDVKALSEPGALEVVRASDAAVCLMHMQGEPQTMQIDPRYDDVVGDVEQFLRERVAACERAGIARDRIVIDPGFGFGKTKEHNIALLRNLARLARLERSGARGPFAQIHAGKDHRPAEVGDRVHCQRCGGSLAVQHGASIVRVHDVRATRMTLLEMLRGGRIER